MNQKEIEEILIQALEELFEVDRTKITPQTNLYEDLEIDSIDAIDLIDYIKKKTSYKLQAQDFRNVRTVEDVICAVEKLQQENEQQKNP